MSHIVKSFEIGDDALYANIELLNTGNGNLLSKMKKDVKWVTIGDINVVNGTVEHIDKIISVDAIIE